MKSTKRTATYRSLADWRAAHGLTLREAGQALGYSEAGYHKLESGARFPRRDDLWRIHRLTGVSLEHLVRGAA